MKNYALVIPTSGEMNKVCVDAWRVLSKGFGLNYTPSISVYPHLTLTGGSTNKPESEVISTWEQKIKRGGFQLRGNGLGVFINEAVTIYVRWPLTSSLKALYDDSSNLYAPICKFFPKSVWREYWVPKTTIAHFDMFYANLQDVLNELKEFDFTHEMQVKELSIVEYGGGVERHIKTLYLD